MSVIEDVRQVVQDLVAPQLKSLDARLTSLESMVNQRFAAAEAASNQRFTAIDQRFTAMETTMNHRFAGVEAVATARHEALMAKFAQLAATVASNHAAILQELELEKRMRRIEAWQTAQTAGSLPPSGSQAAESSSVPGS